MVMVGESCSEGRGFESLWLILDGHLSHRYVVKVVMFVCRKDDNKQKRLGIAHFYEKYVNKQKEVLNAPRF